MQLRRAIVVSVVAGTTVVTGCASQSISSSHRAVAPRQPAAATVVAAPAAALATDQACTRRAPAGSTLQQVRYRADDVAAMTLSKAALGRAVSRYRLDDFDYGFTDNVELPHTQLGPKNQCTLNRDYRRIVGFTRAFYDTQTVWTADHLFFSDTDAAGWLKGYVTGMKALPGSSGVKSVRVTSLATTLGAGAARITISCTKPCSTTHVVFRRGSVVGDVFVSHRPGVANVVDPVATARKLSGQIGRVTAAVAARAPDPADAVMQLSAGLPKSALGARYAGLTWDWFFGGCWDVEEGALQTASAAAARAYKAAAAKFGQLMWCRAMYSPSGSMINGIERAFTGGTLYKTASGASGAVNDTVAQWRARAGKTVDGVTYGKLVVWNPGTLGDQRVGLQQKSGGITLTRVLIRHGRYVAQAALNARAFAGMTPDVKRWASLLDQRVTALLGNRSF